MNNSPWIQIKDQGCHQCDVFLNFGNKKALIRLPLAHVDQMCKRLMVNSIRRYVNHRDQIIGKYGGHQNPEALTALTRLKYAFNGSTNRWSLADLPQIIKNWESDLLAISPGPKSKFYKNQTQLLIDLIAWANHEIEVRDATR